jgi:hypothetical protein
MIMTNLMARSAVFALGLLALAPATRAQQYEPRPQNGPYDSQDDERYARPRQVVGLEDDLRLLDDSLNALPRRHPRYWDFRHRADALRTDVSAIAEQLRVEGRLGRAGRQEVATLRATVATLRDEIEDAINSGRGRPTGVVYIPAGTDIEVMLEQDLSSRSANPEDRVSASTVSALRINRRTVVPAGATVQGRVREVRSRGRGQQEGLLRLEFNRLAPDNGPAVDMHAHVRAVADPHLGREEVRNGGLGALLGGVVGGIIDGRKGALIGAAVGAGGGVMASHGSDVDLPAGTVITLRLDQPLAIARRRY